MESVIKWRTGKLEGDGYYLVTERDGGVCILWHREGSRMSDSFENVVAWYPIRAIEPYKE